MRRLIQSLAVPVVIVVSAGTATAHNQFQWWPSGYSVLRETTTWRTTNDSFYARAPMAWNSTHRPQMLHMATHGYRFTHDVQDLNNHVSATGRYLTALPSPYYDRDAGVGGRWVEGEITSESASFPATTGVYNSRIEFSHWYFQYPNGPYTWDGAGGTVAETAQISQPGCGLPCDKWDAAQGLADKLMGNLSYPSVAAPSSALIALEAAPEGAAAPDAKAPSDSASYLVGRGSRLDSIVLVADRSEGLGRYKASAHRAAKKLLRDGAGRAVVTFARPISLADVRELESMGLLVESVEAVTTDNHGPRLTLGSVDGPDLGTWLADTANETEEELLGIVSAVAVLGGPDFDRLAADDRVFLLDLSIEHYVRGHKDAKDIVMNDVSWAVAGWED